MTRFARLQDVFTRVSTYMLLLSALSAAYGIFGAKPQANWAVVKASDSSTATTLPSNDPEHAPPGAVLYKGIPVNEEEQKKAAQKLAGAAAALFAILAAALGQKEPALPPTGDDSDSKIASFLLPLGIVCFIASVAGGCSLGTSAERQQYQTFRDGVYAGTELMRTEYPAWASYMAGDTNKDGRVTEEDGPAPATSIPGLSSLPRLPVESRDAWLGPRLEQPRQFELWYRSSKSHDLTQPPEVPDNVR